MSNMSDQPESPAPVWFHIEARPATPDQIECKNKINGRWPRDQIVSRIYTMLTKAVRSQEPEEFTVLMPLYNEDACNFDQFVFTFIPGVGEAKKNFFDARVFAHPIFSNSARTIDHNDWTCDVDHLSSFMNEEEVEKVLKIQRDYRMQDTFLKPRSDDEDDDDVVEFSAETTLLMHTVKRLIIQRKVRALMVTMKWAAYPTSPAVKRSRED